jgi:hypothetical protein
MNRTWRPTGRRRRPFRRPIARIGFLLCLLLAAAPQTRAFELSELDFHLGQAWIGNGYTEDADGNSVQGSDVSPLNFTAGFGAQLELAPLVKLAPTLLLYWQEYLETPSGKAVPTQIETGSAAGDLAGSLALLLSVPYVYEWSLNETMAISAGASPSFVFRLPVRPIEGSEVGGLYGYFFSEARFIVPEILGSFLYRINETVRFGINLRIFLPVHNLWTKYEVAFFDEAMILPNLELRLTP